MLQTPTIREEVDRLGEPSYLIQEIFLTLEINDCEHEDLTLRIIPYRRFE